MKPISTFKLFLTLAIFVCSFTLTKAQSFVENFDLFTTLSGSGWLTQNNSNPVGGTSWYQGVSLAAGGPFNSFNGVDSSYVAANYNSTSITGNKDTISNWLISPVLNLRNGDTIKFYTQTEPAEGSNTPAFTPVPLYVPPAGLPPDKVRGAELAHKGFIAVIAATPEGQPIIIEKDCVPAQALASLTVTLKL